MGSFEKLLCGKDNVVHAVNNSPRKIRIKRPIQKLCPLEIDTSVEVTSTPSGRTTLNASDMSVQMVREKNIPTLITAP